ncbi:hypothetical protein Fot_09025 [Forsythia ovata]|uniref:Uncharacterized protein n=1 Tax=Forsythia ovata TaxID=205694 RepID=A0ABD1WDD5_9LAMI
MGKKHRRVSASSKQNSVKEPVKNVASSVRASVEPEKVIADSSTTPAQSVSKVFWEGLCRGSPEPIQNRPENVLDAASFPVFPSKSALASGSRTLGDTDTDSDCSSEKPKAKSWLSAKDNKMGKTAKAPWVNLFKDN